VVWWRVADRIGNETSKNAYLNGRLAARFSRRIRGYAKAPPFPCRLSAGQRKPRLAEELSCPDQGHPRALFLGVLGRPGAAPVWECSAQSTTVEPERSPMPHLSLGAGSTFNHLFVCTSSTRDGGHPPDQ